MKIFILLLLCLGQPGLASAQVQVAFIEMYNASGELLRLTPDGRFAHSAVSYQNGWIHAYPWRGVELISTEDLERLGHLAEIIEITEWPPLSPLDIAPYLGKAFDSTYSWDNDSLYCSELVAKLLGLEPEPMFFDEELWPADHFRELNGQPGLSPDAIYRQLTEQDESSY